jgi:hypothetical protein
MGLLEITYPASRKEGVVVRKNGVLEAADESSGSPEIS